MECIVEPSLCLHMCLCICVYAVSVAYVCVCVHMSVQEYMTMDTQVEAR